MIDTKQRVLDAAEQLFAAKGLGETSLRAITAAGGVNIASIHYHFGSKDELIRAVFLRRVGPLNARRLMLLENVAAAYAPDPIPIETVLRCLVRPALELSKEAGGAVMGLMGRIFSEPRASLMSVIKDLFADTITRFVSAIKQACPHLDEGEVMWRLHFTIGAMAHAMAAVHLSNGEGPLPIHSNAEDLDARVERLVRFCAAGFVVRADGGDT